MLSSLESYQKNFMKGMIRSADAQQLETVDYIQPAKRLPVYQDHYQQVLLNSLISCFGCTLQILGESDFHKLARQYIYLYPSISENLNEYGHDFSVFISMELATVNKSLSVSWVKDLAHCDFLRQCCYYANNHQTFDLTSFINLAADQQMDISVISQACLKVQKSKYNLLDGQSLSPAQAAQYSFYLHYREEGKVKLIDIDEKSYTLFKKLKKPTKISSFSESQIELLPIFINQGWIKVSDNII